MSNPTQNYIFRFIRKEPVAKDTYSFYFDRRGTDYDFSPGQYNRITIPIISRDGLGNSRDFTVSSSPLQKDILMITVKTGTSDFKKAFFTMQPDTPVKFFGPVGGFILRENELFPHVFLAGGIGITPFYSMISYAVKARVPIPITLLASFTKADEMLYYSELRKLTKHVKHINIIYTLTKPESSWNGETGRISERLIKKYVPDIAASTYYIVGSPEMISETEELLYGMHVLSEKVKIEQFSGY